nr:MAG TPA: hypothetical protein [Ackermannviridae sp.]
MFFFFHNLYIIIFAKIQIIYGNSKLLYNKIMLNNYN